MKFSVLCRLDGTLETQVLDREEQDCSVIHRITDGAGDQVSEEELPDDRGQFERVGEN